LGRAENDYTELPPSYSFIKTGSDHVMLYAVKQMESFYDRDAIVRLFEYEGREGDVTLDLPYCVQATETNLLEEAIQPVGEGKSIRFRMKPWEIKTLRLARLK
jgi:alpha-mannosidase